MLWNLPTVLHSYVGQLLPHLELLLLQHALLSCIRLRDLHSLRLARISTSSHLRMGMSHLRRRHWHWASGLSDLHSQLLLLLLLLTCELYLAEPRLLRRNQLRISLRLCLQQSLLLLCMDLCDLCRSHPAVLRAALASLHLLLPRLQHGDLLCCETVGRRSHLRRTHHATTRGCTGW